MELKKYKENLKEEGVSGKEMAKILEMTYGSYRCATMSSSMIVPKWVKSFNFAYELKKNKL